MCCRTKETDQTETELLGQGRKGRGCDLLRYADNKIQFIEQALSTIIAIYRPLSPDCHAGRRVLRLLVLCPATSGAGACSSETPFDFAGFLDLEADATATGGTMVPSSQSSSFIRSRTSFFGGGGGGNGSSSHSASSNSRASCGCFQGEGKAAAAAAADTRGFPVFDMPAGEAAIACCAMLDRGCHVPVARGESVGKDEATGAEVKGRLSIGGVKMGSRGGAGKGSDAWGAA